VRLDSACRREIEACATPPRRDQTATWITPEVIAAYTRLHELGYVHSAESWRDGQLVGGLYGVSIGGVFTGESMFALESDASKVAFVTLVRQLERWGFLLLDAEVYTEHLARFGAREWPRERFLQLLRAARQMPMRRGPWRLEP
jgi:leucyl/phenylalanyl-tRNA--protein transferase